jgi:hypothetical protein
MMSGDSDGSFASEAPKGKAAAKGKASKSKQPLVSYSFCGLYSVLAYGAV